MCYIILYIIMWNMYVMCCKNNILLPTEQFNEIVSGKKWGFPTVWLELGFILAPVLFSYNTAATESLLGYFPCKCSTCLHFLFWSFQIRTMKYCGKLGNKTDSYLLFSEQNCRAKTNFSLGTLQYFLFFFILIYSQFRIFTKST